jgi:hypothetical protein
MSRQIPGDPLTGQLPRTRLIVPQDPLGPVRNKRSRFAPDEWPRTADPIGYTIRQLTPGRIVTVRLRFGGIRRWKVRMVSTSHEFRNKGRHYIVAMDSKGWCHTAWVHEVISVSTAKEALAAGRVIDVRTDLV